MHHSLVHDRGRNCPHELEFSFVLGAVAKSGFESFSCTFEHLRNACKRFLLNRRQYTLQEYCRNCVREHTHASVFVLQLRSSLHVSYRRMGETNAL